MDEKGIKFTYSAYRNMLKMLKSNGFIFCGYDDWVGSDKPVILRHDIDFTPFKALRIAEIEAEEKAKSTFFFLLRSEFYNFFSPECMRVIEKLNQLGHSIGLHFDEAVYAAQDVNMKEMIANEAKMMKEALGGGIGIHSVSMHRPSEAALKENWEIPGLINSYSKVFFEEFEYISDSRRCWKKSILDIVASEKRQHLHILTHPIWYNDIESSISEELSCFIENASIERLAALSDNITDVQSLIDDRQLHQALAKIASRETVRTERLILRPFHMDDVEDMYEFTSDDGVCKFLNWGPYTEVEQAKSWLNKKMTNKCGDEILFGIVLSEEEKLIGTVRAYKFDEPKGTVELSYILNPAYQGKGYAGEAVKAMTNLCLDVIGFDRVNAYVDTENEASCKLLKKIGFDRMVDRGVVFEIKGQTREHDLMVLERS